MTAAIRFKVHTCVANPEAMGPCPKVASTHLSAAASKRGLRPARPALRSPAALRRRQKRNHRLTVYRENPPGAERLLPVGGREQTCGQPASGAPPGPRSHVGHPRQCPQPQHTTAQGESSLYHENIIPREDRCVSPNTDIQALVALLPAWVATGIPEKHIGDVEEIILDLGRQPTIHLRSHSPLTLNREVVREDIQYVLGRACRFREDNRSGIERTLHRIACIRDRYNEIIGFTFRAGRAVEGAAALLEDLLATEKNLLVVGPPAVGKTTLLRSAAAFLADRLHRRVIIADTSNEIGGDGQIPHPSIGNARRLQIPLPDPLHPTSAGERQAQIILQAVVNHGAQSVIVDEIGFESDARVARTIGRRGVQLVATAHGRRLLDVIFNPDLAGLVGNPRPIPLSSDEMERRTTNRRVTLERLEPPVFDYVVELARRDVFVIHPDVATSVDLILAGLPPRVEVRRPPQKSPGDNQLVGRNAGAPDDEKEDTGSGTVNNSQKASSIPD